MKFLNIKALDEVETNDDISSKIIDASPMYKMSVQVVVGAGTVSGDLIVEVSNDPIDDRYLMLPVPENFTALGAPVTLAAGTSTLIPIQDMSYSALRFRLEGSDAGDDASLTVQVFALAI